MKRVIKMLFKKSQLLQMDPCDRLYHAHTLYTKIDVHCYKTPLLQFVTINLQQIEKWNLSINWRWLLVKLLKVDNT